MKTTHYLKAVKGYWQNHLLYNITSSAKRQTAFVKNSRKYNFIFILHQNIKGGKKHQYKYFLKNDSSKSDFIGEKTRKESILKYLIFLFECLFAELKNQTKTIKFKIFYLTFLLEAYSSPIKCLVETFECLKYQDQYYWQERCLLEIIKQKIVQKAHEKMFNFSNQKLNTLISIQFDEMLTDIEEKMLEILPEYRNYLNYISQNSIDIQFLEKIGKQYIKKRNEIDKNINNCYLMNPENKYLSQLTYIYIDFLDFQERRQKDFKRLSFHHRTSSAHQQYNFTEKQLVIFISLLKPVGQILKFSHNLPFALGYTPDQIQSKSLNILLPSGVAKVHDQILYNFINQGSLDKIEKRVYGFFFLNNQNFLVPAEIQLKIDQNLKINQLGVSALCILQSQNIEYITYHQSGRIQETTERLYTNLFSERIHLSQDKVSMLDIHKIIPQIGIMRLINDVQLNKIFKGYIIIPKYQIGKKLGFYQVDSLQNIKSQLYNLIQSYEYNNHLFLEALIEIKMNKIGSIDQSINFVSLSNLQLIRSKQEKENIIDELQEQAQQLMAVKTPKTSRKSQFFSSSSLSSKISKVSTRYFRNSFVQDEKRLHDIQDLNSHQTTLYDNEDQQQFEEIEEDFDDEEEDKDKNEDNQQSNQVIEQQIQKQQKQILISNEWEQSQIKSFSHDPKQNENVVQGNINEMEKVKPYLNENNQSRFESNNLSYNTNRQLQEENVNKQDQESKLFEISMETDRNLFSILQKQSKQDLLINGSVQYSSPLKDNQKTMSQTTNLITDQLASQISQQRYIQQTSDLNDYLKDSEQISSLLYDKKVKKKQKQAKRNVFSKRTSAVETKKSQSKKQNIASSVNSTRTLQHQRKQDIIYLITNEKKNQFFEVVKYTGFASLLILVTVTSVLFSFNLQLFQEELSQFNDIPYAVSIRADYSLIIKNTELQVLLDQNTFGFQSDQQQQVMDLYNSTIQDNKEKLNHYQQMVIKFYRDTKSNGFKDYMLNATQVLKNYAQMKGYKNQTFSLPYAFLFIQESLYYYMNYGIENLESYNNVQQNFIAMFAQYTNMQNVVVDQANSLCDTIVNLLYASLITILTISFFFILIIFPIYSSVQLQRENILKLNSTFDPSKFELLINQLSKLIEKGNVISQQRKNKKNTSALNFSPTKIPSQGSKSKKKMISSTTNLKRYNILLILGGIFIFILLAIYPIVNLIVIKNFINDAKYNINEISILYSVRAQLTSNYAANYMAMSGSLLPGKLDAVKYGRVQALASSNQSKLQQILSIFNDFSGTRYDDGYYKGFFLKILKGNICDAFQEYPQFVSAQYQIDDSQCRSICNGVLQQGLYIALQYVFNNFQLALPFFDKTSVEQFIQNMRIWVQNIDFFEFNQLYLMMINIIESERVFMEMVTSDYFSYITQVTYALFFYSLFCLLFIFYFCWVRYFRFLSEQMTSAKRVLSVVPIGYLIENPYVMSYLEKENKK
ncbi:transmembrane protein, putative (macronuclear) [Tetrahymena thermophila SB210]|uniref:Transmembrane protein, putative n=1 Tax=Tetrahymena thermophila (strain SB210) TaxID=312017 RepID=I7M2Z4_TETTS|nr:transmembrane protein, putative [Tetrahymena thermophila SB210]EAS01759.2 transmembrane protein, putative [Tetrahymena thermophila SB210]|eukprot:XP_001022004.2 transmembrane protein, putative [Tetrahymena thermophila SB210]